eukprot:3422947-Prymnesium_polylepis.3
MREDGRTRLESRRPHASGSRGQRDVRSGPSATRPVRRRRRGPAGSARPPPRRPRRPPRRAPPPAGSPSPSARRAPPRSATLRRRSGSQRACQSRAGRWPR